MVDKEAFWIDENVGLFYQEDNRDWSFQMSDYLNGKDCQGTTLLRYMKNHLSYPLSIVTVDCSYARQELGYSGPFGDPILLIEGHHRLGYLLELLDEGLVPGDALHKVIIAERG